MREHVQSRPPVSLEEGDRSRNRTSSDVSRGTGLDVAGWVVLAAVAAAILWRLPLGLDLSDEAYYAGFIDDWLKGSIASSPLSTVHQTAALIVYPAAKLFVVLTGSSDGMALFLRALFLLGALSASAAWLLFLRRLGEPGLAPFVPAIVLAFVPFGLPAPSYNTLGLQGSVVALAGYGCSFLASTSAARAVWAAIAAAGCAVALVA